MRAKKFGVSTVSADAKKLVRAERFGLDNGSSSKLSTSVVNIIVY